MKAIAEDTSAQHLPANAIMEKIICNGVKAGNLSTVMDDSDKMAKGGVAGFTAVHLAVGERDMVTAGAV